MKAPKQPFHLVLQAPNGTDIFKVPIHSFPPFDDTDTDEMLVRGEQITEFLEDGMVAYMEWLLTVKKRCNCFAKKKPWLHPTKHMHSGDCRSMRTP